MSRLLAFCVLALMGVVTVRGQIEFPENVVADKGKTNAAGRIPLYAPTRCGPNELLYPGDQENDWICDCEPAAIYHPETEKCYAAFRQGPCASEEIFVLGREKVIPECLPNPCKVDGEIPINNVCYRFGGGKPCQNTHLSYVLGVNPQTLQVDCIKLSVGTRVFDEATKFDLATVALCARGMERYANGNCTVAETKQQ